MRVKPTRPGLLVKCPVSRLPVPAEGREVPENGYWLRRIAEGSLQLVEPTAPPKPEPAPELEAPKPRRTTTKPTARKGSEE